MNNEDRLFAYFATLPVKGALHTPTNAYRGNVEWRGVGSEGGIFRDRIRNFVLADRYSEESLAKFAELIYD